MTTDTVPAAVNTIAASVAAFLHIDPAALVITPRPFDDGYATPGAYTLTITAPDFWPVRYVNAVEHLSRLADQVPAGWFLEAYGEHTLCITPDHAPAA